MEFKWEKQTEEEEEEELTHFLSLSLPSVPKVTFLPCTKAQSAMYSVHSVSKQKSR